MCLANVAVSLLPGGANDDAIIYLVVFSKGSPDHTPLTAPKRRLIVGVAGRVKGTESCGLKGVRPAHPGALGHIVRYTAEHQRNPQGKMSARHRLKHSGIALRREGQT